MVGSTKMISCTECRYYIPNTKKCNYLTCNMMTEVLQLTAKQNKGCWRIEQI